MKYFPLTEYCSYLLQTHIKSGPGSILNRKYWTSLDKLSKYSYFASLLVTKKNEVLKPCQQVGEGVLTKMCRKKPKPRQFYLFNDLLVYGNIIINKKKYNKQHIIPLEEV
jgi:hypothetical protein